MNATGYPASTTSSHRAAAGGGHCGATLTKRVTLEGQGRPHIIGCAAGLEVFAHGRVGFFLPGNARTSPPATAACKFDSEQLRL